MFPSTSETPLIEQASRADLVILDAAFTDHHGIDTLMEIASAIHLPILMLTPPDDAQCAVEAMRNGAFNYLVKTKDYHRVLPQAVQDALTRFDEIAELKRTILVLKGKIAELEGDPATSTATPTAPAPPQDSRQTIIATLVTKLRAGEINLPGYPEINATFGTLLQNEAGVEEIATLLMQDPAIASKLISMSNSVYYRGMTENRTVAQAISRLGLQTTKQHVELITNRAFYTINDPLIQPLLPLLWAHSLACAHASQMTAQQLKLPEPDTAFTMGLLHDIGMLMLLQVMSEFQMTHTEAETFSTEAILDLARTHHGAFGKALLDCWKFSEGFGQIAQWHEDVQAAETVSKHLLVVAFANGLVKKMGFAGHEPIEATPLEDTAAVRFLNLTPAHIEDIEGGVRTIMSETEGI